MSVADFYQSIIDELEDDYRYHALDTNEFIEILMKYVQSLARSKDESASRENEIISEKQEKKDELEICVKDKFLMS